jgi:hypothetical protein
MEVSTKLTTLFDEDSQDLMNGKMYLVYYGDVLPLIIKPEQVHHLLCAFHRLKLNRYYDCIQKAKITAEYLGIKEIHLGSLMIESTESGVYYGYLYNPPLELHAWVQLDTAIIDFALAGTIEKGLITKDEVGPFLVCREPVILAGTPAPWMHYQTYEIVSVENVNQLDIETAKELLKKTITWK